MIRVLVVDDYQLLREALRALIEGEPDMEVIGEAGDGSSALQLARHLAPTVIVMDVDMPIMDGIEATRRIVAKTPGTRVIAYSATLDSHIASQALAAGAIDFVSKRTAPLEILRRIRSAACMPNTLSGSAP